MSLSGKLRAIRQKPRHVRERYLVLGLIVAAAVLLALWILTFRLDAVKGGSDSVRAIGSRVSESFADPAYSDAFGTPLSP